MLQKSALRNVIHKVLSGKLYKRYDIAEESAQWRMKQIILRNILQKKVRSGKWNKLYCGTYLQKKVLGGKWHKAYCRRDGSMESYTNAYCRWVLSVELLKNYKWCLATNVAVEVLCGRQILNRQTFKALPACELINLTSLVGRFYAGSALHVWRVW